MSSSLMDSAEEISAMEKLLAEKKLKRIRKKGQKRSFGPFQYLIVFDFEATRFQKPRNLYKQEIIQFPAVLMNLETGVIEKEFNKYLRPIENPILSDYCKKITGITQDTVDNGELFPDVVEGFKSWIEKTINEKQLVLPKTKKSDPDGNCAFVIWGNWDFLVQLPNECYRKQVHRPEFFNRWINLKEIYNNKKTFENNFKLSDALEQSGIELAGRPHKGLDDARNTAVLAWKMHNEGSFLSITKDLDRNVLSPVIDSVIHASFVDGDCIQIAGFRYDFYPDIADRITSHALSSVNNSDSKRPTVKYYNHL